MSATRVDRQNEAEAAQRRRTRCAVCLELKPREEVLVGLRPVRPFQGSTRPRDVCWDCLAEEAVG